jgi:hypothetical protein
LVDRLFCATLIALPSDIAEGEINPLTVSNTLCLQKELACTTTLDQVISYSVRDQ